MHSVSKETGKQQDLNKIFSSEILTVIDGETQFVSDVSLFEYLYWCWWTISFVPCGFSDNKIYSTQATLETVSYTEYEYKLSLLIGY